MRLTAGLEERPWKGDIKPAKKVNSKVWVDENGAARVALLKAAWPDTKTYPHASNVADVISKKFGEIITKSAVISKANSLGLGPRGSGSAVVKSNAPAAQIARAEKVSRPPFLGVALRLDPMPETGITFEELKTGMCRFALGGVHDPVLYFCGDKADGNYCSRHASICSTPRMRRVFKEAA